MPDWIVQGRRALQRGDWEAASCAFERAVAREPGGEALEGLGWSLYWLDRMEESLTQREHAYRAYLDRGDAAAASRVAIGLAVGSFDVRGPSVASGWLERARTLLRGLPPSIVHGWVALYEGHFARITANDLRAARRHAQKAARLARRFEEPQLELLARALEGLVMVNEGNVAEGMRRVDEATTAAMAGEMRDLDAVAQTCCILLYACERVRDYKRAAEWQARIDAFCREWEIEPLFAVCRTLHAAMQIGCGEWREAERALDAALIRLAKTRPLTLPDAIVQMAELRRRQGRSDEAMELIRRAEGRTEAMLTRAELELERGDVTTALEFAERVLARPAGEKWIERAHALELVVRAAMSCGNAPRAREALRELESIAARIDTPMVHAIAHLAAGHTAASPEEARAGYVDAVQLFADSSAPFETANARMLLAGQLDALGRTTAAREERALAAATLAALGVRKPARSAPSILTSREREVLRLIADGLGDKQLAVKLSLSEHTVHRHVANILRKLGAGSRSAAVAHAVRSGIL